MTGMAPSGDDRRAEPASAQPTPTAGPEASALGGPSRRPGVLRLSWSIWLLENVQDLVTAAVGVVLIALAGVLLVSGIVDSLDGSWGTTSVAATTLLDRVLLVLILVEIVYTVVLSLREHRLVAQPFIVVGLIAVIRRILFVLNPVSRIKVGNSELALLIAMVAVFVAALLVLSRFEGADG